MTSGPAPGPLTTTGVGYRAVRMITTLSVPRSPKQGCSRSTAVTPTVADPLEIEPMKQRCRPCSIALARR